MGEASLFPTPAAGFEAPLEMLAACHTRIQNQCSTLLRLKAHVAKAGADEAARSAARGVIRYFDKAGRDHHEDEEKDLFPALIEAVAGSDPVCLRELIDALTEDHRQLARLWESVRTWLAAVEAGAAMLPEAEKIDAFVSLNQRHIEREEQELLPMAGRLLETTALDQIGRSMRLRRGVTSI